MNVVYGNQFRAGSPGALSSGGWGLANPVVPGGASLLASLVSIPCIVVTSASSIAALSMKEMTAIITALACRSAAYSGSLFIGATPVDSSKVALPDDEKAEDPSDKYFS